MNIVVNAGLGTGPTELGAFDQALVNAGIANFNLIYLSSVLPPGSTVKILDGSYKPDGQWGDRLYVVMAQERTSIIGQEVWAGIGWIQDETTKQGLLVEHEGHSENQVRHDIEQSLTALAQNRGTTFGPIQMHVVGGVCKSEPVCALVSAVFQSEPWNGPR